LRSIAEPARGLRRDSFEPWRSPLIEAVLEEAEALVGTENLIRNAVRDGLKPLAAYEQFGKF
jgi:hypothetical protein